MQSEQKKMPSSKNDVAPISATNYKTNTDMVFQEDNINGHTHNGKKGEEQVAATVEVVITEEVKPADTAPPSLSIFQLFRFADGLDQFFLFVGLLAAWITGLCMPAMTILFGNVTNSLVDYGASTATDPCTGPVVNGTAGPSPFANVTGDEFFDDIKHFAIGQSIIGAVQLTLSYIMVSCMNAAAERQVYRIRHLFLRAVLRQDISWYDTHQTGEFASRTAEDLNKLLDGIGEKIGMFNFFLSTFLFCVINAFVHGWELTLVMLSVTPIIVIAMGILGKVQTTLAESELKCYAVAGSIAEEVITAMRTVVAFGGEKKEVLRYDENLVSATKAGIYRGMMTAIGGAILWFVMFGSYALAFWYGIKLILDNPTMYSPSNLVIVFFSVIMGAMNMGQSAPYIEAFSQARAAGAMIFEVIDRVPPIDSSSQEGLKPESVTGELEFEDVHFNYPSRPDVEVLTGLSLKVSKGETVALVGESGCGKSTTVQLIQRFYDPLAGIVKLDGCDVRLLNLGWLRDNIGIVGQEPVLFGTTIAENIRYGRDHVTQEDIENAGKEANAHNFIMKLPKKYETMVGDRGTQLSGGQKQRVAIARALIKNPKILLLDEATSALDSESEAIVQEALDKARLGRTTIIIAHRLSTIRNADKIVSINKGKVSEKGTHEELMALNGIYRHLVDTQTSKKDDDLVKAPANEVSKMAMSEYQRSISVISETSLDEMTNQASVMLGRSQSLRRSIRPGSLTSEELQDIDPKMKPSLYKVLKMNKEEWVYIMLGCIGAVGMGFSMPAFSLVFGDIMGVLSTCDPEETRSQSEKYAFVFIGIGSITAIAAFFQIFMLSVAGEYLTKRLRKLSFAAMMKQEMAWFDEPGNSVGALCTRLSSDASSVQGATGSRIGTILQSVCTLGASTIIALVLCWQLALVSMCFIPLVLVSTYFHAKIIRGQSVIEMASLDTANKIAIEAISNIRTVASLHKEEKIFEMYISHLKEPHRKALNNTHSRGFVFGFAQSVPFFAYATTMYYGGVLILKGSIDYETMFKVSELLIMGTMMVGQAFAFAPNFNKGMISAARIFLLLERKPLIDSSTESGLRLPNDSEGLVEFKGVEFQYPMRKNIQVLRGLDLKITPGHVVALVGSSGCGKSTCIQLLERFYDPVNGIVTLDGVDTTQLNIQWLRSRIGIVSQEPILFDRTIAENIAYGDNNRDIVIDEIMEAAKNANIHNFISTLPLGYNTSAGDKGAQLSGGQKQRIAIARALIRNPRILLLDEATSALDSESEKVVQEALDKAQKGRTCITVAHRLSTIKDANMIAVIDHGRIVESGTHDELLARQGHYYKFYQAQSKRRD